MYLINAVLAVLYEYISQYLISSFYMYECVYLTFL